MNIDVYTLTYNEEIMLPYFLRYYKQFARKIVIYDNGSTDKTLEIAKAAGAEVRVLDTGGKHFDTSQVKLKNECYRESRGNADWVIVVDCDEFIYHEKLVELLKYYKATNVTVPKVQGFDMVSESLPTTSGQIYEEINLGWPEVFYSKRSIFHPKININFTQGCHNAFPKGQVRESKGVDIKLLHYRFIGIEYLTKRLMARMARMTPQDIAAGAGSILPPPGISTEDFIRHCYKTEWTAKEAKRIV